MFTRPDFLFKAPTDLNRIAFYQNGKAIDVREFYGDIARYVPLFQNIPAPKVILYIKDNVYLFCVCFMALLLAQKDIVLPAGFNTGNSERLQKITPFLITDFAKNTDGFSVVSVPQNLPDAPLPNTKINKRCVSFFTSGSTGEPKQIIKPFNTLTAEVDNIYQTQKHLLNQNPVVIASVVPYHIYGMLWHFLFPLSAGIPIDSDVLMSPEELQHKQQLYPFVLFATTPSFMDKLVKYQDQYQFKNNCLAVYSSGSLLNTDTSARMFKLFSVSPFEIFGSTETGGVAYRQQKDGLEWRIFNPVQTKTDELGRLIIQSDFACDSNYVMQDAVQMTGDKTFTLLGRLDRLVKIAEKRISLPEMEQRYLEHTFIQECHILPINNQKTQLGAILVLTDAGKTYLKNHTKREIVKILTTHLKQFFEPTTLPKKTRIVYEIPKNNMGKILAKNILPIFQNNRTDPVIENVQLTDDGFEADLTFIPDSLYFKGHFPEVAILAGVAQLHFVDRLAQLFLKININGWHIHKLKFAHLILPSETIHFTMKYDSEKRLTFSYQKEDKICSSGIFVWENIS